MPDNIDQSIDFPARFFRRQPEAPRLRQMSDDATPPDSIRLLARINRL